MSNRYEQSPINASRSRNISKDDIERFIKEWNAGIPIAEIQVNMGRAESSVAALCRRLVVKGVIERRRTDFVPKEVHAQIRALAMAGKTPPEIAAETPSATQTGWRGSVPSTAGGTM